LTVYPTVKPFDPILARFIYDLLTTLFSLVLFCTIGMWTGMEFALTGLDVIFAAYFITWLIGCGLGLIFGVMASHYKEVEQVVPVVFRPMMFVSAVFFPTNILPPATRDVYLYNPIVHTIELSRNALFPLYRVEGSNLLYPMVFAIIVLSIGIAYYEKNKYHLSQL
jgi:capsular polysaccharide transport system permease protein